MKCKRLLSLALSGAMLFGSVSLLPESAFSGNAVLTAHAMANYEYDIKFDTETETDRITLTSFSGDLRHLVVPTKLGNTSITAVGDGPIVDNMNQCTVTIPACIQSIGSKAFGYFTYYETGELEKNRDYFIYCVKGSAGERYAVENGFDYAYIEDYDDVIEYEESQYVIRGNSAELAYGVCRSSTFTVPSSVEDFPVTAVGARAFCRDSRLIDLIIPDSVTKIGEKAFYYSRLNSVVLPDTITYVGAEAFAGTDWARKTMLNSEDCLLTVNNILLDAGGYQGSDFTVPQNIRLIADSAFAHCEAGTVILPEGITEIGKGVFRGSQVYSVDIPETVTSIGEEAFSDARGLREITIPETVTSIGEEAFSDARGLREITIPGSVKTIGIGAFRNCEMLDRVTLSDGITSIGDYAFYNCTHFCGIVIPDSVISLGEKSFGYGLYMDEQLNEEVERKRDSFYIDCNTGSMAHIYARDNELDYNLLDCDFRFVRNDDGTLTITNYDQDRQKENVIIPSEIDGKKVKAIGNGVFSYRSVIKNVTIPEGITDIGNQTFCGCDNLESVSIPDSVTRIGNGSFSNCKNLKNVTIPPSVTELNGAFANCSSLESVTIPASVTSINGYSFYNCSLNTCFYCYKDSAAHLFAEQRNLPFALLDAGCYEYSENEGGTLTITKFSGELSAVAIPSEINGKTVTAIGPNVFENCKGLTRVVIPDTVTQIGEFAFSHCENMTDLVIPNGVKTIGKFAFSTCKALRALNIPDTVTSIGNEAFNSCESIESVVVPEGVESLGLSTFEWCSSLRSVTLPSSLKSIGKYVFGYCTSLKTINIPEGITHISEGTFTSCSNLESITLPDSVVSIEDDAFGCCKNLKTINIPDKVTSLGSRSFSHCEMLESISLPQSLTTISDYAFCNCPRLSGISIPDSVTSIGSYAFSRCSMLYSFSFPKGVSNIESLTFEDSKNLSEVIIPDNITSISKYALHNCENLKDLTVPASVVSIQSPYPFGYVFNNQTGKYERVKGFRLHCYKDSAAHQFALEKGLRFALIDAPEEYEFFGNDDGTVTIAGYYGNAGEVVIPSTLYGKTVTAIGPNVFKNCKGLTKVVIPDTVKEIGEFSFSSCVNMTDIVIPVGVTTIGKFAFSGCKALRSLDLPATVASIGNEAFNSCESIQSVVVPEGVESLGLSTFEWCSSLRSVTLPSSLKSIGKYVFGYCTSLETINIPEGITHISDGTFTRCSSLETITLPNSLQSVGENAFSECTSLKTIKLPNNVTSVDDSAFDYCKALSSVTLSNKLVSIGTNAFYRCDRLRSVCIPESVTTIESNAIGYVYGKNGRYEKIDGFRIYCYKGTAGEQYAVDNGFEYEYAVVEHVQAKQATCVADGNIEYWLYGGKYYSDSELTNEITEESTVTKATGKHSFGEWKTTKRAACTEAGQQTRTCSVCKKSETKVIPKLGHNYKATVVPPTCTKEGYTLHKCSRCDDEYKDTYKDATGHKYGTPSWSWTGMTAATAKFVCSNNKNHARSVKATITSKTTKATCTTAGKTVYTATVKFGGKTYTNTRTVTLKALGHSFSAWKTTSFNVDKKTAVQTRKCSRCSKTETQTVNNAVARFAGNDRAETASLISNGMYKTARTVVIATGFYFHDALAAIPLASAYSAPLLLADRDNLSAKTIAEIKRLKAKNVIVVATTTAKDHNGCDAAIKSKVYTQLKSLNVTVTKLTGKTYYETAKKVADKMKAKYKKAPTSVFITTDKGYADTLTVSSVAANLGAPIIYVDPKAALDSNTKTYLAGIKTSVKNVYIVGGVNAVSKNVEKAVLSTLGKKSATRFAGDNRYDTCIKINNAFNKTLTGKYICITTGQNFPDALAGGVYAALKKSPLMMVNGQLAKPSLTTAQTSFLKARTVDRITAIGGTGAVLDAFVKAIAKACV